MVTRNCIQRSSGDALCAAGQYTRPPRSRGPAAHFRLGFTLVELLCVCAVVAVLIGLLLPAVQAAREAARLTHCQNNLRQIATGLLAYHDQMSQFPSGGWGHEWIGVGNRGFGKRQPGGWIFNLLPYLELSLLRDRFGADPSIQTSPWLATSISVFACPTRRPCEAWPISQKFPYMLHPKPGGPTEVVARGDYAINSGATLTSSFAGPPDLTMGDLDTFNWPITKSPFPNPELNFSGISHVRTGVSLARIEDGASNTYLAGEKFIDIDHYTDGEFYGDNESLFSGFCTDNHRFTKLGLVPIRDAPAGADVHAQLRFGSAHAVGALFVFCDGSGRLVTFDVADEVHFRAGHIADAGIQPTPFQ
jgi:prepilin-type N-terminal cleavage/methylation domain-containing protein